MFCKEFSSMHEICICVPSVCNSMWRLELKSLTPQMVLWSCKAPQGEHLNLSFWSCSDLCVTETSSESQLSAGNEITVDSLGRNSELKFFFFNIKKKKKEGIKKEKFESSLNWKISYFSLSDQKYSEGNSF